jgi:HEAT repeat protein
MAERDPSARLRAVRELPDDPSSSAALLQAASDPSLEVARAALLRLERLGGAAEARVLRARLFEADLALVADYARALGRLGDGAATAEAALGGLGSPALYTRVASCVVLRELAPERGRVPLLHALDDRIASVRRNALDALARLEPDERTERRMLPLLADPDPGVRRAAVAALAAVARNPSRSLGPALDDGDASVRAAVAAAAAVADDRLVEKLLCDRAPAVRAETLARLEAAPRASVLPLVRAAVDDPSWQVRRAAVRALRAAGDRAAPSLLVARLVDESALVAAESRRTLAELHGRALPAVVGEELHGRDARVRTALAYLLGDCCLPESLESLVALSGDPDPDVRIAVARTLAPSHAPAARAAVERLRVDASADVRNAVDVALSSLRR